MVAQSGLDPEVLVIVLWQLPSHFCGVPACVVLLVSGYAWSPGQIVCV